MAIYCYIFVIKLLMRWTEMLKFNERRKKLTSHTHTQKKDTRRLFKDNDHNNKISIILTRFLMARMWAWRASKNYSNFHVWGLECVSSKEYQFKLPRYRSAIKALFITSCISLRQDLFFTSSTRAAERKLKYGFYGEKKTTKIFRFLWQLRVSARDGIRKNALMWFERSKKIKFKTAETIRCGMTLMPKIISRDGANDWLSW